jgi:hypothetical protein
MTLYIIMYLFVILLLLVHFLIVGSDVIGNTRPSLITTTLDREGQNKLKVRGHAGSYASGEIG